MAYLLILALIQNKLVVEFGYGVIALTIVGVIAGVYLVLSGLLAIPFGHLTDKYGRRTFAVLGSFLGGVALLSILAVETVPDPSLFFALLAVFLLTLGFGHATYTASTWAYVGDIAREQNMGKSYGLLEIAEYGAFAFGPGVGVYVATVWGRQPALEISGVLLLAASAIAYLFMPESARRNHGDATPVFDGVADHGPSITWGSFLAVLKNRVVAATLLTTFLMSLALQAFYIYIPLFAQGVGNILGPYASLSGFLSTLAAGTSIFMMVPFGFAIDVTRRRMPWLVSGLLVGSLSLIMVFLFRGFFFFAGAAFIFGVALAMSRVSQAVILAEGSAKENRATVMGTNHAVEHTGYGAGAVLGGSLIAALGLANAFRSLSIILLFAAVGFLIFAYYRKLK